MDDGNARASATTPSSPKVEMFFFSIFLNVCQVHGKKLTLDFVEDDDDSSDEGLHLDVEE